jgi:hypothetical protein
MTIYKKEFFIVELKNYDGLDNITVREVRDSIMSGLENGLRYISIVDPEGVNRAEQAGHTADDIEISEYIIVLNDEDEIDIEKTANEVTKDFLDNGMIICMRNAYEEIKASDGSWIDDILGD